MLELFKRLEIALQKRNPALLGCLQPGLPAENVQAQLSKAKIKGKTDPLFELYAWRDGTQLQGTDAATKAGIAPPVVSSVPESELEQMKMLARMAGRPFDPNMKIYVAFNYLPLRIAILHLQAFRDYAANNPRLSVLIGRYFPVLWNGSTAYLALDLDPSAGNRVVAIEQHDDSLLREAYDSYPEFLTDWVEANEKGELLHCICTPGAPIPAGG